MESSPAPLQCQKKIDLLESNGFKRGDISFPDNFTRIRSLDNFFHIKNSIPYHVVMTVNIGQLEEMISQIDEDNEYELNRIKTNYIKEFGINAF